MIYADAPEGFNPKFEVAACFVMHQNSFLLMKRSKDKFYPLTWGVPAGKKEPGEESVDTAIRETREETGIILDINKMIFYNTFYVRYPELDFIYHIYSQTFEERPSVVISEKEHTEYRWVKPDEALKLELIRDEDLCIKHFFKI